SNTNDALELAQKLNPHLVVADLHMPGSNGIDLIKRLRAQKPDAAILVLSMHEESVYAERSLRAGARGYVMKQEASERLLVAIEQVLRGEIYLSERMKRLVLENMATGNKNGGSLVDRLSDRELEILTFIGEGFSTRRVADDLHLSVKTIESYRETLKLKLGLKLGSQLVQYAIQWRKTDNTFSDQQMPELRRNKPPGLDNFALTQ
ncbi:MAG TPA: response regulator transcription factor, partial [Verrucomicrobiae bacterium]|nr:response regulator transcription factor [Verrucomicrobiae bacterium]